MKVLVAGGKLQGVEAAYLAHQAGWEVALIDRDPAAPALGLADHFFQLDLLRESDRLARLIREADFVIPAIEELDVLELLKEIADREHIPVAGDPDSYRISSSKKESDRIFARHRVSAPRYWPDCTFPVIAKPSGSSGSRGVIKLANSEELGAFLRRHEAEDYLVQEFLEGDSYSIEVIGFRDGYLPLQTTDLEMDCHYDCKRVVARTRLAPELVQELQNLAVELAGLVRLVGIMDVEVIDHHGVLKVLEIDARLPSQTPTVVYQSSGINMLPLLYDAARGSLVRRRIPDGGRGVVYEHIQVGAEGIATLGEHIISTAGPLTYRRNFFGADEALTNYAPGRATWVATLIITAADRARAWEKRCRVIARIGDRFGLPYHDAILPDHEPAAEGVV